MKTASLLRRLTPAACVALALASMPSASAAPGGTSAAHPLRVSADGRHLVRADGRPFFYLADTAWSLFHRLTREEADLYLRNRAAKGFTVIQAVALSENDGLRTPNAYGERPLAENDPRRPNEKYFAHVDWVVDRAAELGLTVALLPTWGDKWHSRQNEPGPKVFADAATARDFARFIGRRYGSRPVIFVLGGDRNVETPEDLALTRAFAEGLKETAPKTLVTFHPRGPGRSSDALHREPWLDFNMIQSSHTGRGSDNGGNVEHDRALEPAKPTLDGEPRYEALMADFYMRGANPAVHFDDYDVRLAAYRALLAGAAGHTYGNNNIWQMWAPGRDPVLGANTPWSEAIDHPGAFQMGHVRRLFESRPVGDARAGPGPCSSGPTRRETASCARPWRATARSPSSTRPGASRSASTRPASRRSTSPPGGSTPATAARTSPTPAWPPPSRSSRRRPRAAAATGCSSSTTRRRAIRRPARARP